MHPLVLCLLVLAALVVTVLGFRRLHKIREPAPHRLEDFQPRVVRKATAEAPAELEQAQRRLEVDVENASVVLK